ncbi:MAG TPA: hypothetical protein PKA41_18800, partial [Verrucomicrobiota bacterium]|nr:hypothetical protein [Verrucomicrobiota bacterium]
MSDLRITTYDLRGERHAAHKSYIVNRKWLRLLLSAALLALVLLASVHAFAEPRFPPPDFSETNHELPSTTTPPTRAEWLQYLDVGVLTAALGVAIWLIYRQRSRRGLFWLGIFSL